MKKVCVLFAVAVCATVWDQEKSADEADAVAVDEEKTAVSADEAAAPQVEKAAWPVWLAFNSTKNLDVVGFRFTLPFGSCEGVTGFDLGLWGRCRYMEGFQLNLLRNDVGDTMAGVQLGLYNSIGRGDMIGIQVGLWNEARSMTGIQVGIINVADSFSGIQVGLINRVESLYGFQLGGVNVIRESELPFCPILNMGLDQFSDL